MMRATHILMPEWDAENYMIQVQRHRGTFSLLVPTMIEHMLVAIGAWQEVHFRVAYRHGTAVKISGGVFRAQFHSRITNRQTGGTGPPG